MSALSFVMPGVPEAVCCGYYGPPGSFACECDPTERALRAYASGKLKLSMTTEQRAWCLAHIAAVEGYKASDYAEGADAWLAKGVMDAWFDYCRDKGLLS